MTNRLRMCQTSLNKEQIECAGAKVTSIQPQHSTLPFIKKKKKKKKKGGGGGGLVGGGGGGQ